MPDHNHMRKWERLNELGTQLMQSGDYAGAADKLIAAVDIKEDDWATWLHLGLCFYHLHDLENAVVAFQNAATLNPHSAQVWNNLGTALGDLNDWKSAASAFDAGINADPTYARNYLGRGNAYLMAGDRQSARSYFQQATVADPDYAKAWQALSQLD